MRDTQRQSRDALLLSLRRLSHDALVCRLKSLTARERRSTALLVAHLAELDTRDVYLRAGFSSLFTYCRDVLALSDDEAYSRIVAARTARRFPVVLDLLAAGDVNVTMVRMLGPHLTAENHLAVLEEARGKRKADVEEIVARLSPRPDIRPSVRKLPEPKGVRTAALQHEIGQADPHCPAATTPAAPPAAGHHAISTGTAERTTDPLGLAAAPVAAAGPAHEAESVLWPASRQAANVQPLSPDRYKYQLTIGASTLEKLRLAKDMLRHALPSGDDEAVLDRALTALLRDLARKKLGAEPTNTSSRKGTGAIHEPTVGAGSPGGADSRHIPVEVKRAVWLRDLGRCAFIAADGHRCGERAFVEFHTSDRMQWVAARLWTTSSSGAGATTATRRACSSGVNP